MHADNKRLEKWADTRLWNSKFSNEKLTTRALIQSATGFFKINLNPNQSNALAHRIEQIRDRVDKRYKRYVRIRARLAGEWMVPPSLIDRWYRAGWIEMAPQALRRLTNLFIERDYTRMISPEIIPIDPKQNIWA
jgi:hypothetical protein